MDQINFMLLLDKRTARAVRGLAGHMSAFGFKKPKEVTANLSMPKPVVNSAACWMESDSDDVINQNKLDYMMTKYAA